MTTPLVLFGTGHLAEVVWHFISAETTRYQLVGFTVEQHYLTHSTFCGLPVFPFEQLECNCSPDSVELLIVAGPRECNRLRERIWRAAMQRGYRPATYVSRDATIGTTTQIGEGSLIFPGTVIDPFVTIGRNAVIWSGALIAHHTVVEDHVYCAPRVAISGCCVIGTRSFLGTNATIRDHVTIASGCVIGCGAVIKADTLPDAVYSANPTLCQTSQVAPGVTL